MRRLTAAEWVSCAVLVLFACALGAQGQTGAAVIVLAVVVPGAAWLFAVAAERDELRAEAVRRETWARRQREATR